MAKIIRYLLTLHLLIWSNYGFTWSCSFSQTEDGWYQDGSMVCDGIDTQVALEEHYCTWYRPQDPICSSFIQPICVDSIEYITESCPPNSSGGIQKSRTYVCQQASWTDWSITSNNCTPDPATCFETTDSRTIQCGSGYDGQIIETRLGTCSNPYAEKQYTEWLEESNSCVQSQTDPISPIAVTNPINLVTPTIPELPESNLEQEVQQSLVAEESQDSSEKVKDSSTNNQDTTKEDHKTNSDGDKKERNEQKQSISEVPKEISHGFGLVLSIDVFQKPMDFYQPPLEDPFSIIQEFPVEQRILEQFYTDILRQNVAEDYYISNSNRTWDRIRRSDLLQ